MVSLHLTCVYNSDGLNRNFDRVSKGCHNDLCTQRRMDTYVRKHIHTHTHTNKHIHMRTYTCAYILSLKYMQCNIPRHLELVWLSWCKPHKHHLTHKAPQLTLNNICIQLYSFRLRISLYLSSMSGYCVISFGWCCWVNTTTLTLLSLCMIQLAGIPSGYMYMSCCENQRFAVSCRKPCRRFKVC